MDSFDHEKLDVYQVAMNFVVLADSIAEPLRGKRRYLADQLLRASMSIALNIAEGAGEYCRKEKARFYRIALRSATECSAVLDACKQLHLGNPDALSKGRSLLLRIVSMLIRMAKRHSEQEE